MSESGEARQRRGHERIELEVEVVVKTGRSLLPGRTQDISESGICAILPVELLNGEGVGLQIKLPSGTKTCRAIVRHRNIFRHGFEFLHPIPGFLGKTENNQRGEGEDAVGGGQEA